MEKSQHQYVTARYRTLLSRRHRLWLVLSALVLLASACNGLAGEPEIVSTLPPQATSIPDVGYPVTPPNLAQGAQVYAARCVRCHGDTGAGDGEMVLSGQIQSIPDLTNPQEAASMTPYDWFGVITDGRLDKLMPPWKDTLSEQDRWSVAMYTYTLTYQADQIASGRDIWTSQCAECHGDTGQGDGPRASEFTNGVGDLTNQQDLVQRSDDALAAVVTNGTANGMPAYSDTLDEGQRRDVVAYLRTLSLAGAGTIGQAQEVAQAPVSTEEGQVPAPETTESAPPPETTESIPSTGTVTGMVANGTAGGDALPTDLTVTLHVLDSQFNEQTFDTSVNPDGTFIFNDVPFLTADGYITTVIYKDNIFGSDLIQGTDIAGPSINLPINVYEVTDDPSVIEITAMVIQVTPADSSIQVTEIVSLTNTSDRLFTTQQSPDGTQFESVTIPLPQGAQWIDDPSNQGRYIVASDGSSVADTQPVLPGEQHLLHMFYSLPYNGQVAIDHKLDYTFNGQMHVLLPNTLSLTSQQLNSLGPNVVGTETYDTYGASLSLNAGDSISYDIVDAGTAPTTTTGTSAGNANILPYALIAVGGIFIFAAALLFVRGGRGVSGKDTQYLIDGLIREIADLDQLHEAGKIDEDVYQKRRQQFKTRLAKLMKDQEK